MTPIVLYDKDECPFCWRVRMSLAKLGVDFERRAFDDPQWSDQWPALTRQGTVPVLVAADITLTDSAVMLEYLQDQYGGLLPTGAVQRAQVREVLRFSDTVIGPGARDLIFAKRGKPEAAQDQDAIAAAIQTWRKALPDLSGLLGDAAWFGPQCGMGDYAVATRFGLAFAYGMPRANMPPNLSDWWKRMTERVELIDTAPKVVAADWAKEA